MSDDHSKQGSGSNAKGNQQGQQDDGFGEEKTQLVDLDALQGGDPEPQFAPPPTMDSGSSAPGSSAPDGGPDAGEATQLFEIPPSMDDDDGDSITSSAPDYGDSYGDSNPGAAATQPQQRGGPNFESGPVSSNISSGSGPSSPGHQNQPHISSDEAGHEGSTQFLNVADFADQKASFTPEQEAAGYDGNTQFVDVNALQAGAQQSGGDPIDNDRDLHRGYQFGADDIQHGDITLIDAKNPLGKDVLLKRVWEGRAEEMTTPLRERIAQLHELKHPNLISMNGMFVSDSGMWVELDACSGQRLTQIIEQNGPLDPEMVLEWMESVAEVLEFVHSQHLAYANLTTDSIWVGDGGSILVEPFDMLRLEDRGNLGSFGPPEMNAPPDKRQLSPATDVYSLAATIAAAITGLPLQPAKLAEFENQKLVKKLHRALAESPDERPQSATDFVNDLQGGGLDIKIVGGGAFAAMVVVIALLAVVTGGDDPVDDHGDQFVDDQAQAQPADEPTPGEPTPDEQPPVAADDDEQSDSPDIALPGQITTDPRLTITTSFETNPPADAATTATDEQLDRWRQEARQLQEDAEDASSDSKKFEYYTAALERLAHVIRSQDEPSDEDWDAWHEVYRKDAVQDELKETIEGFSETLLEGRFGTASRRYNRLATIDPRATASNFLDSHNSAIVVELTRDGAEPDEDDDND